MKQITTSLLLSLALLSSFPARGMKLALPDSTTGKIVTLGIMGIGAYVVYRLQQQQSTPAADLTTHPVTPVTTQRPTVSLEEAAYTGNIDALTWHLSQKRIDPVQATAALRGAISQKKTTAVEMLIQFPSININAQNANGYTLLREAVEHNQAYFIRLLLEHNANPNIADKYSDTPLMRAAGYGHEDCVRNLLRAPGIDTRLTDKLGRNAATIAKHYKHPHIADAIEGRTILQ